MEWTRNDICMLVEVYVYRHGQVRDVCVYIQVHTVKVQVTL